MRFLFRLDLSLLACVGNFFWNFDFLRKHGPSGSGGRLDPGARP